MGVTQNVQFFREDSEHADWDYPTPFDYIHLRCVLSCFDDHRTVMRKSFENLHHGGWIELMDPDFYAQCTDGTLEGSHLERLFQTLQKAMAGIGKDLRVARNYKQWLIETGFVDVVEELIPTPGNVDLSHNVTRKYMKLHPRRMLQYQDQLMRPLGNFIGNPWPTDPRFKEMGQWSMTNQCNGLRGMCWKILRSCGMEPGEIEDIIRLALRDIRDTRIHFYWPR